mmetsp:Transcript_7123/g.11533  ORF Transcript_7123/g.11533 Transcript_7123/m.11533 type:complete len:224 (+) Transcript_7123:99-770(+)
MPTIFIRSGISFLARTSAASRHCFASTARCPRAVLGVGAQCSEEDVKHAFRAKAKQMHPDLHPDDREAATARFQELQAAYRDLLRELKGGAERVDRPSSRTYQESGSGTHENWSRVRETAMPDEIKKRWWLEGSDLTLLMQIAVGLGIASAVFGSYWERAEKQQEREDQINFAEKRYKLRQAAAEKKQRELEDDLRRRGKLSPKGTVMDAEKATGSQNEIHEA